MPFGHNCEYPNFDACVRDQQKKGKSEEQARKICGALQRDTEAKCRKKGSLMAKQKKTAEKPTLTRAELKNRMLVCERRLNTTRKVLGLDPAGPDAKDHAMGVAKAVDLFIDGKVNSGKWTRYVQQLKAEIPQLEMDLKAAMAAYRECKLSPQKDVLVEFKARDPEPQTYAARHIDLILSIPQSRALQAIREGISSEHLEASSADAMRYLLDRIAEAL